MFSFNNKDKVKNISNGSSIIFFKRIFFYALSKGFYYDKINKFNDTYDMLDLIFTCTIQIHWTRAVRIKTIRIHTGGGRVAAKWLVLRKITFIVWEIGYIRGGALNVVKTTVRNTFIAPNMFLPKNIFLTLKSKRPLACLFWSHIWQQMHHCASLLMSLKCYLGNESWYGIGKGTETPFSCALVLVLLFFPPMCLFACVSAVCFGLFPVLVCRISGLV